MQKQELTSDTFDVVVIGAGVEGSSSAYHLAKNGEKTLLLEQFPLPHSRGSSHGQSRIIRYAYELDLYVRMMMDAYPLWNELAREAGVDLFRQCGLLNVGPQNGKFLTSLSSSMHRHGIAFEQIAPRELAGRYPMLKFASHMAAVFDPQGGILRADKALGAFQSVFKQMGGVLRDGEKVTSVIPGQPLVTVTTTKRQYCAKKVVIATGPWTSKLLRPLGLNLPLRPMEATVLYWEEVKEGSHASDHFPCLIVDDEEVGGHVYGLPSHEYPGLVKVCLGTGPGVHPDHRDQVDTRWIRDTMATYVSRHLPCLRPFPAVVETCITTDTPDENPVIDYHPKYNNIVIAAGFSGHGFKLAPAVGKAVAELVQGRPLTHNMALFAISRFIAPSSNL